MNNKTYVEFGSIIKGNKNIYQTLKGNVYDTYMMSRYFRDIYFLEKFNKDLNLINLYKSLHHKKDFKFNLINYIFLKTSKSKKFYEFGQTLFEKIFFIKAFNKILNSKINKKIIWCGNDISKFFNFFCKNFYSNFTIKLNEKPNFFQIKKSIFFSKGISLLYEKKNLKILRNVFKNADCGSFDFTVYKKNKNINLNTGYKMYYPSMTSFLKAIPQNNNFTIFFKNIKKTKQNLYFEVVFGKKKEIIKYRDYLFKLKKKYKNDKFKSKIFDLNSNLKDLQYFKSIQI